MKMEFSLGELIELEYALADWAPSDDECAFDAHKAFYGYPKFLTEIAWETEVWVASDPDHFIHFNGDRFLGPH